MEDVYVIIRINTDSGEATVHGVYGYLGLAKAQLLILQAGRPTSELSEDGMSLDNNFTDYEQFGIEKSILRK